MDNVNYFVPNNDLINVDCLSVQHPMQIWEDYLYGGPGHYVFKRPARFFYKRFGTYLLTTEYYSFEGDFLGRVLITDTGTVDNIGAEKYFADKDCKNMPGSAKWLENNFKI